MPVRMKDIAKDLGLSVVTVSKVLRNHSDISESTRRRVLQRIREVNYRPDIAARSLVTGKSFSLGLIVPDLVHAFFAQVARAISEAARKKGFSVLIASSDEDPDLEREEIGQMLARRVDALIIASAQTDASAVRAAAEGETPLILIDRRLSGITADFVGFDDQRIGLIATNHLLDAGYTRVVHIRGPRISTGDGRSAGYRRALARRGLEPCEEAMGEGSHSAAGYRAMQALLARTPLPDAVFCYNDPAAVGAMKAIFEAGLRIPDDIAVMGCGHLQYADMMRVPLSSVDQDSEELGFRAARMAFERMNRKSARKAKTVLIAPKVIARESTRRRPVP